MVEKQSLWTHISYCWETRVVLMFLLSFGFGFLVSQGQHIIGLEFLGIVGWGIIALLALIFLGGTFLACFYYFREAKYTNDQLNEMMLDYQRKIENKRETKRRIK